MKILKKPFPATSGSLLPPLALALAVALAGCAGPQPTHTRRSATATQPAQVTPRLHEIENSERQQQSATTYAQTTPAPATTVAQAPQTPAAQTRRPPAPSAAAPVDELDAAITAAGNYLNGRIQRGDKIAFVSADQNFPAVAGYVIDGLIEKAVNDGVFFVVDRAQLDAIRLEQEFQMSGAVNDSTVQSIGRILGVRTIATVTVTQIADEFRLDDITVSEFPRPLARKFWQ